MSAAIFNDALVESLFPDPSFAASNGIAAPAPSPGITPESTATLRKLLSEDHKNFHGFHNHLSHHLLAAYALGSPAHVLQGIYDNHSSYQRPAYQSPESINRDNWTKHLGDEDFYNAYMNFFSAEIKEHGLGGTLEKYVFSHEANWANDQPRMLDRFIAGVFHPIIHFGYAAEFGIDGMAVEGLAQAAVHHCNYEDVFDATFFTEPAAVKEASRDRVHSFTLLSRILADDRLKPGAPRKEGPERRFGEVAKNSGGILRDYASLWTVSEDEKDIKDRVEELHWLVTLLFGVGGWENGRRFRADFFFAHLVTSNIFLSSITSLLKPKYQIDLLRAYMTASLVWFVTQGRPALDIQGFFQSVTANPEPSSDSNSSTTNESEGNPWYTILMHSVLHPDEHLVKAQRALAHSAALHGMRPKGSFAHTELKGAENIDGTLFIRSAGLLMEQLRWNYDVTQRVEGIDLGNGWDRAGLSRD
ncbi:unnamed protein product [Rhizoctonia solani]|uniref:Oxidoreductase AflY n=1 Tax=Rhizoctonia solani TaxID=456999 RepID=A0A8H2X3W1_9AGAM|nr:unnamed protein product [Rhizoctonia solani]